MFILYGSNYPKGLKPFTKDKSSKNIHTHVLALKEQYTTIKRQSQPQESLNHWLKAQKKSWHHI